MPFDGNCFITTKAFQEIQTHLDQHGNDYKYFVIPMARLLNNTELLTNMDERPNTPEEPQIMFRYDAEEVYNLNMRYGRRSKVCYFDFRPLAEKSVFDYWRGKDEGKECGEKPN